MHGKISSKSETWSPEPVRFAMEMEHTIYSMATTGLLNGVVSAIVTSIWLFISMTFSHPAYPPTQS